MLVSGVLVGRWAACVVLRVASTCQCARRPALAPCQAWMREDDDDVLGAAEQGPDLEEDAAFEEQAEAYEQQYNFRFEVGVLFVGWCFICWWVFYLLEGVLMG